MCRADLPVYVGMGATGGVLHVPRMAGVWGAVYRAHGRAGAPMVAAPGVLGSVALIPQGVLGPVALIPHQEWL